MTITDPIQAGLLADIRANPADDTPRLVYADWLEEHGHEERARLIRVQVAASRPGGHDAFMRYRQEARWGPMLLEELRGPGSDVPVPSLFDDMDVWLAKDHMDFQRIDLKGVYYVRGFPAYFQGTVAQFHRHAYKIAWAPIECVELVDWAPVPCWPKPMSFHTKKGWSISRHHEDVANTIFGHLGGTIDAIYSYYATLKSAKAALNKAALTCLGNLHFRGPATPAT